MYCGILYVDTAMCQLCVRIHTPTKQFKVQVATSIISNPQSNIAHVHDKTYYKTETFSEH